MEWAHIRCHPSNHNSDVKHHSEACEADQGVCDKGIYGPHVSTQSTSKEEEGDLEHHHETLDKEVEWPLLQPIAFALTVPTMLNHRPTRVPQVSIQPLLPQHGNECSEQGDQETQVHQAGGGDDLTRWIFLSRWDNGGLTGDGGLVESEKDSAEEGGGFLVRIGLEVRANVDDKSRVDS